MVGSAEESGPVDGAVVAQLAVLGDVDVAGADLPQGLELQRGDALLLQDQQRDSAERGEQGGGERRSSGPDREGRGMKGAGEDERESREEKKIYFSFFSAFEHCFHKTFVLFLITLVAFLGNSSTAIPPTNNLFKCKCVCFVDRIQECQCKSRMIRTQDIHIQICTNPNGYHR